MWASTFLSEFTLMVSSLYISCICSSAIFISVNIHKGQRVQSTPHQEGMSCKSLIPASESCFHLLPMPRTLASTKVIRSFTSFVNGPKLCSIKQYRTNKRILEQWSAEHLHNSTTQLNCYHAVSEVYSPEPFTLGSSCIPAANCSLNAEEEPQINSPHISRGCLDRKLNNLNFLSMCLNQKSMCNTNTFHNLKVSFAAGVGDII